MKLNALNKLFLQMFIGALAGIALVVVLFLLVVGIAGIAQ